MAEDYPSTAFPMLLALPPARFYPQAMCRAVDAIKPAEMNGILSDLWKKLAQIHPVSVDLSNGSRREISRAISWNELKYR